MLRIYRVSEIGSGHHPAVSGLPLPEVTALAYPVAETNQSWTAFA